MKRGVSLFKAANFFAVMGRKKIENSIKNYLNNFLFRVTIWQRKSLGFDAEAIKNKRLSL